MHSHLWWGAPNTPLPIGLPGRPNNCLLTPDLASESNEEGLKPLCPCEKRRGAGGGGEGRRSGRRGSRERMQLSPAAPLGGCPALPKTALPQEAPGEGLGAFLVRPPAGEIRDGFHRNGGGG